MAEEEDKKENLKKRLGASIAFETGVGLATDWATAPLLAAPVPGARPLYYGINYAVGAGANIIGQNIRGEEDTNWGEVTAAGGFQTIPFGTTAKGLKGIRQAAVKGGAIAVGGEQVRVGIDEQRLITPREAVVAGTLGAGFGSTIKFGTESADILIQQARADRLARKGKFWRQPGFDPESPNPIPNPWEDGKTFNRVDTTNRRAREETEIRLGVLNKMRMQVDDPDFIPKMRPLSPEEIDPDTLIFFGRYGGMRGGKFDFDAWRDRKSYRKVMERFQTPEGKWVPTEFTDIRKQLLEPFLEEHAEYMQKMGLSTSDIQLHHIYGLNLSAGLYDGLTYMSDDWITLWNTLDKVGVTPGSKADNLMLAINNPKGPALDRYRKRFPHLEQPHSLLHEKFFTDLIGKHGQKFFTKQVRKEIRGSMDARLHYAKEYAKIVKRGEELINDAMDQISVMYSKDRDPEKLTKIFNRALDDGTLPSIEKGYKMINVERDLKKLVKTVKTQFDKSDVASRRFSLQDEIEVTRKRILQLESEVANLNLSPKVETGKWVLINKLQRKQTKLINELTGLDIPLP